MKDKLVNVMNSINSDLNKNLRQIFKGQINGSFLIRMEHKVINSFNEPWTNYYNMEFTNCSMLTGQDEFIVYDICRHIIGIHHNNCIFKSTNEIKSLEDDNNYCNDLVNDVITQIKLRKFGSLLFRQYQIYDGDNFMFYKIPYLLFVMCIKVNSLDIDNNLPIKFFFNVIINKALSAFTLIENNMFDNAYPICRGVLELYFKYVIISHNPESIKEFSLFNNWSYEYTQNETNRPKEFENRYKKYGRNYNKAEYANFGWLESIPNYHNVIKDIKNHYSIKGLLTYIERQYNYEGFTTLKTFYDKCHTYTHSIASFCKYPIKHYFELCFMLFYPVLDIYNTACRMVNDDTLINGINIIEELISDKDQLLEQYDSMTDDKLKEYYKK